MSEQNNNAQNDPLNFEDETLQPSAAPQEVPTPPIDAEPSGKVIELQTQLDKAKDQMLRALADAENARKRAVKEREDASKYSIATFAKEMLIVSDNLRRALEAIPGEMVAADPRVKNLVDGIEATQRQMQKSFEQSGIRQINPQDEPFNANFHEVMFEAPGTGKPAGTVIQVIDVGYILHDRLLRPARVGVAKNEGQGSGTPGHNIDTQA